MASDTSNTAAPSPKQLVFFFMAATVVAVVVFLCGVLVGRGVPLRQVADAGMPGAGNASSFGSQVEPAVVDPVRSEPSAVRGDDDLTYPDVLGDDDTAIEPFPDGSTPPLSGGATSVSSPTLEPPPREVGALASPVTPAVEDLSGVVTPAAPAPVSSPTPARATGYAYTVQVAALRAPGAAEQVAGRLIAKGFPAYVLEPSADAPVPVYRVRVGQYRDHDEAERIRRRLEDEEQFKPWITR